MRDFVDSIITKLQELLERLRPPVRNGGYFADLQHYIEQDEKKIL